MCLRFGGGGRLDPRADNRPRFPRSCVDVWRPASHEPRRGGEGAAAYCDAHIYFTQVHTIPTVGHLFNVMLV